MSFYDLQTVSAGPIAEDPAALPMGSPNIVGNTPKSTWGQHHRITGKPWYRSPYDTPEAMFGGGNTSSNSYGFGDGEGSIDTNKYIIGGVVLLAAYWYFTR